MINTLGKLEKDKTMQVNWNTSMLFSLVFALFMSVTMVAHAQDLTVVTFNTESDDADTSIGLVSQQIAELGELDILAMQEVESTSALSRYTKTIAETLGGKWRYVISESGYNRTRANDLLGIVYNSEKFRQVATTELHMVRSKPSSGEYGSPMWSLRGVLLVRFVQISTGLEFQIGTMHLKCCNAAKIRKHQAKLLSRELQKQPIPTILLGDSNIPIDPMGDALTGDNLETFSYLTTNAGLSWIKPENPMPTQCSSNPNHQSMLDQIYVSSSHISLGRALILFPEDDFCELDSQGYADHRPIKATFSGFFAATPQSDSSASILDTKNSESDEDLIEENSLTSDRPGDFIK